MQTQQSQVRERQNSISKYNESANAYTNLIQSGISHVPYSAVNLHIASHNASKEIGAGGDLNTGAGEYSRETHGGKIRSNSAISRGCKQNDVALGKTTVSRVQAPKGSYLLGWGQLPFKLCPQSPSSTSTPQCIPSAAPSILKYSIGQAHCIYITTKYQAFGLGSSKFGELGYLSQEQASTSGIKNGHASNYVKPIPLLEEFIIQDVFCTPFCTFFITNRDQVYGCGLNNRGQLGIPQHDGKCITTPIKIWALSKKSLLHTQNTQSKVLLNSAKKSKINKIQSYALAQRKINLNTNTQQKMLTQKSQGISSQLYLNTQFSEQLMISQPYPQPNYPQPELLHESQFIQEIVGGPYHSLALTSKGRAFYTGNIYKKSSILTNEHTPKFTELNLKKIGKVSKIKSGVTCIGLLNVTGALFVLGVLGDYVCDQPYLIGGAANGQGQGVAEFCIAADAIWGVWDNGDVFYMLWRGTERSLVRVQVGARIVSIDCGIDYCMMLSQKGQIFATGNNYGNIFGTNPIQINKSQKPLKNSQQPIVYKLSMNTRPNSIKCSSNYTLALSQRAPQLKINLSNLKQCYNVSPSQCADTDSLLKRICELEKQNKILKQLIKQEPQQQNKTGRNSARKKQQGGSVTKKLSNFQNFNNNGQGANTNNKFDLGNNVSEKIISKARKFDNSMEIPFEELQLGKQISEGGYGIIYKALWRKTTVAVKIFKIDTNSENSIKDFVSECHAMQALRHPNIVMFLGACTKPPNFAIVLQYCEGGTLWSILQKSGELSWQQRRKFALDTARGMNYLHQRPTPILHRDLKSLNLLLDDNKRVKLADFGWTKGLQNYMTGKIGTYQWMAPQVVSSHQYTEKADVFSFAIILWEIASREAPYRNIPGAQVAQDVLNKDLRPIIPKKTPEQFAGLMKKCWSKNAESRPSFAQIIEELQKMQLPA